MAASGWSRSPPRPPPSPSCCGPTRTGGCRRAAAPRARSSDRRRGGGTDGRGRAAGGRGDRRPRSHPARGLPGHRPRRRHGQLHRDPARPGRGAPGPAHPPRADPAAPARQLGLGPRLPARGGAGPVRRRDRLDDEQPRRRDLDRRRRPARAPATGGRPAARCGPRSGCCSTTTASSRCPSRRSRSTWRTPIPTTGASTPPPARCSAGTSPPANCYTVAATASATALRPRSEPAERALAPSDVIQERFTALPLLDPR